MAEEAQAVETQEVEGGQVRETTEETHESQDEGREPDASTTGETGNAEAAGVDALPDWAQKEIKSLRAENAKRRKADKQREDAEKTEVQRYKDDNESLKVENERLRNSVRRNAFVSAIGLPSPRVAYSVLSDAGVEIEYDDNDQPTAKSLDLARRKLRSYDPRVFGDGSADGGAGGGRPNANDMNALIRGSAGRG